ncbi:MAG: carboxypeptidase-like regulatory domain-containing protein [Fibromonadales bacterium]|nr:carboxypeptidase-like regulatory domain-containing protein [Fibromonadales bacterium]
MKKILPIIAISLLALSACKKGSVSGTVIDPISGEAVELPTVWIRGTPFTSQKIPGGLPDGKFKFEKIEPGSYTLEAGKGKYSRGSAEFTITKEDLDVTQNIYIYRQDVSSGLYRPIEGTEAEKILNTWAMWQPTCKGSVFALRASFADEVTNPKTKRKEKRNNPLPAPKDVPADIFALYKLASSVTSPVEAISYPVLSKPAKDYDCSVEARETLLVPDLDKGSKIESGYKSENLYEIKGTLPKGRQFLALSQDNKFVGLYYLNAQ